MQFLDEARLANACLAPEQDERAVLACLLPQPGQALQLPVPSRQRRQGAHDERPVEAGDVPALVEHLVEATRREQVRTWMHAMIEERLLGMFREHPAVRAKLPELEQEVVAGRLSAFRAAERLLAFYRKGQNE